MKQILLGGLLGGVAYYLWGMLAWMVLPLHTPTMSGLNNESEVTTLLSSQGLATGVYVAPWTDNEAEWNDPNSDFTNRHNSGPIYSIIYQREGAPPMGPSVMICGAVIDILAATLAACLLSGAAGGCCQSFARRVGFVAGLGVFVGLVGHLSYWNWMHFPTAYTIAFVIDVLVGWTLTGLVIATIIRPPRQTASAEPEPAAS